MIAAVDANVLASAALQLIRGGPPAAIWFAALQGLFALVVSQHVLTEVENTLRKPYFTARLSPAELASFLTRLSSRAAVTSITARVVGIATHPEDDLFLATAVSANADYLVTGDLKLQALGTYQGVTIVSPRDFLDLLIDQPPV